MKSGKLRHRITIQQRVETRDEFGGVSLAWQDFAVDVPADVLTGPGRELRAANAPQEEIAARINFHFLPGVTQIMRVVWDGQLFNIRSIELDRTARRETRLICTTGVNDGA
ncbi:phage head closure protein [Lysobacter fragariae]